MKYIKLIILLFTFFGFTTSVFAESASKQLQALTEQLLKAPTDNVLRVKIIKLAKKTKPQPVIPEEATRLFIKAGVFHQEAKNVSGYDLAITAYQKALLIAPWWGDAYYNLAMALSSAEKFNEAINTYKLFKETIAAGSPEAREVQNKIYALEAKSEIIKKEVTDNVIVPGQRIGKIAIGMSADKLRETLGKPAEESKDINFDTWYAWPNLLMRVFVKTSLNTVYQVAIVEGAIQYKTAEGVGLGSLVSEMRLKLGTRNREIYDDIMRDTYYCYRAGISLSAKQSKGTITSIRVFSPNDFEEFCKPGYNKAIENN